MSSELVVLVNSKNQPIGTMPKSKVHNRKTPLHRGFSAFIFNSQGQVLLQQRSHTKKTWPLVWSNSCCGHPGVGESVTSAAHRRLKAELGLTQVKNLKVVAPYRYCFTKDNIMENEICPILVGFTNQQPQPNPAEVEAIKWIDWNDWLTETKTHPDKYSPWCIEETHILDSLHLYT
jgi:isopentenyl-diphosphate Delta-isomerase